MQVDTENSVGICGPLLTCELLVTRGFKDRQGICEEDDDLLTAVRIIYGVGCIDDVF